ncbi:MAG: thioredoxin family protein [Bacteroidia bacterium]|nr:thioredoxin family protein [Bacteroidia bacterium]
MAFENSQLYKDIVKKARLEQKSFFVYFSARWCAPCQMMNKTTFKDQNVMDYINVNLLAVKVDVDEPVGKIWQEEFNVTSLPTMIFFDQFGNEAGRISSGISGTKLLGLLQDLGANRPINVYAHNQNTSYRVISNDELLGNRFIGNNSGVFEVQVGKFAAEKDIHRQMNGLENYFARHRFYILKEKLVETTVFTLVLSGFKDKFDAQSAKKVLDRHNYDARLIQL